MARNEKPSPFTAGASAAVAAGTGAAGAVGGGALGAVDATWWKEDFGIPNDFVREVGTLVQPGDSAIFALLRSADPTLVASQFSNYGGVVLSSNLTPEQTKKVEQLLSGKK